MSRVGLRGVQNDMEWRTTVCMIQGEKVLDDLEWGTSATQPYSQPVLFCSNLDLIPACIARLHRLSSSSASRLDSRVRSLSVSLLGPSPKLAVLRESPRTWFEQNAASSTPSIPELVSPMNPSAVETGGALDGDDLGSGISPDLAWATGIGGSDRAVAGGAGTRGRHAGVPLPIEAKKRGYITRFTTVPCQGLG